MAVGSDYDPYLVDLSLLFIQLSFFLQMDVDLVAIVANVFLIHYVNTL